MIDHNETPVPNLPSSSDVPPPQAVPESQDLPLPQDVPAPQDLPEPEMEWLADPATPREAALPAWLELQLPDDPRIEGEVPPIPAMLPEPVGEVPPLPSAKPIARPVITVSERARKPLKVNPPLAYGLVARVSLPRPAFGFRVEHTLPPNVKLLETLPKATVVGDHLIWNLGRVDPGHEIRLQIVVQPEPGAKLQASELTSFQATYSQNLHFQTPLVRPRLTMKGVGPERLELGQEGRFVVHVANSGNWSIQDIRMETKFSDGLADNLEEPLEVKLGALYPTEKREIQFTAMASKPGTHSVKIRIVGSDQCVAESEIAVRVVVPVLETRIITEPKWILNHESDLRLEVSNTGEAPAHGVTATLRLPNQVEVVNAGEASYDPLQHSLVWQLNEMTAGARRSLPVKLKAVVPGDWIGAAEVIAVGGHDVSANTEVTVDFDETKRSSLLEQFLAAMQEQTSETAGEPKPADRSTSAKSDEQHIIFTLANTDYAVPLNRVLEVGRPPERTQLPNVPDWVVGVANIRGDIVSMVSLRGFLEQELSLSGIEGRMLVVRSKNQEMTTALIVDRVRGMRNVSENRITMPTAPLDGPAAQYMRGVTEQDGRLLVVLDLDRLLLSPKMCAFEGN